MKRTVLHFAALCGLALLLTVGASAQNRQPNQTPLRAARADSPTATAKTSDADKTSDTNKTSDTAAPAAEVEGLKHRVEELENQNRALAHTLADINAKLNAITRTESNAATTNAATSTDAATTANAVAQSSTSSAQSSTAPKPEEKDPHVRWSDLVGEGNRFKLYGFLRLDLDFDSQHPSNTQIPFFITSPDARAGAAVGARRTLSSRAI